ncbi:MAG: hypothetical protein JO235_16925 [Chroococcidiopsidaceae cyanobacterium CP_BM_RX_35]|nr:hypothetical protein [Chroococcidiopsidaceae cyanobacterium CP_BM_RX_35]
MLPPPDGEDMLPPDSEGDALVEEDGLDVSEGDALEPPPLSPPPQDAIRPLNRLNAKAKVKIFLFITPRFTNCGKNNEPLVDYDTAFTAFSTEAWARNLNLSIYQQPLEDVS